MAWQVGKSVCTTSKKTGRMYNIDIARYICYLERKERLPSFWNFMKSLPTGKCYQNSWVITMDTQIGALVVAAIIAAEWLGKFNLQMRISVCHDSLEVLGHDFFKKVGCNEFHHVSSKGLSSSKRSYMFFKWWLTSRDSYVIAVYSSTSPFCARNWYMLTNEKSIKVYRFPHATVKSERENRTKIGSRTGMSCWYLANGLFHPKRSRLFTFHK